MSTINAELIGTMRWGRVAWFLFLIFMSAIWTPWILLLLVVQYEKA